MPRRVHGSVVRSIQRLFSVGPVGGLTDGQLLEQFLRRQDDEGGEAAFAALVAVHGPMVWDVCSGILPDSHAAEDAFQATFLVLARRAGSIRRRDAIGPWLHGVARRVAARARAVEGRRPPREREAWEMRATRTPDPIPGEQLEALHEEVDRLAEKYRAPLVLCYFEGRTHAEAARLLRCPVGTISFRLWRARELLRARLTRRGVALPAVAAGAVLGTRAATAAMPAGLAESTIRAATKLAAAGMTTAGTVPAAIDHLVRGELRIMTVRKLSTIAAGVAAAGLVATGAGLLAGGGRPAPPARAAAAPPAPPADDDSEARGQSTRKLMSLGLALNNFAHDRGRLPAAAIRGKDGKPFLSWRVALLPFLDEQALYQEFHLDEPWDSPHNKALLDRMPDIFAPVAGKEKGSRRLTYDRVFAGRGTPFGGDEGTKPDDIKDGRANTILVVETAEAVPWTRPEELPFEEGKPLPKLGGVFRHGFHVLFADGSVRFARRQDRADLLRALITHDGGEPANPDDL